MHNSPLWKFQGLNKHRYVVTGSANTAIAETLGVKDYLRLSSNQIAELIRGHIALQVNGGNADGDDAFTIQIMTLAGNSFITFEADLWRETIAAATLVNTAVVHRALPYLSDSTKGHYLPAYVMNDEDVEVTATAGGDNVIYTFIADLTFAIWEIPEVKKKRLT